MNVLLVEDDAVTAAKIERILQGENCSVNSAMLGREAIRQGRSASYDLIILDLVLPDIDGYEVLRQLRATGIGTPVLILSGLGEVDDKIKGLSLGADDFLTKPFEPGELIARMRAVIRRSTALSESTIRIRELLLSLDSRTARVGDQPVRLTPKEYAILELLCLRKGAPVTSEFLLRQLYGGFDEPGLKIIDVFISTLRKKLAQASGGDPYIETVRGRGFMLRESIGRLPGAGLPERHTSAASSLHGPRRGISIRSASQ